MGQRGHTSTRPLAGRPQRRRGEPRERGTRSSLTLGNRLDGDCGPGTWLGVGDLKHAVGTPSVGVLWHAACFLEARGRVTAQGVLVRPRHQACQRGRSDGILDAFREECLAGALAGPEKLSSAFRPKPPGGGWGTAAMGCLSLSGCGPGKLTASQGLSQPHC